MQNTNKMGPGDKPQCLPEGHPWCPTEESFCLILGSNYECGGGVGKWWGKEKDHESKKRKKRVLMEEEQQVGWRFFRIRETHVGLTSEGRAGEDRMVGVTALICGSKPNSTCYLINLPLPLCSLVIKHLTFWFRPPCLWTCHSWLQLCLPWSLLWTPLCQFTSLPLHYFFLPFFFLI